MITVANLRVAVVCSTRFGAQAMAMALAEYASVTMVGALMTEDAWLSRLEVAAPDVLLLHCAAGDARSVLERIRTRQPEVRVLVVVESDLEADVMPLLVAGAAGFVLPVATLDAVVQAIGQVASGEMHLSPRATYQLLRALSDRTAHGGAPPRGAIASLTARELEVLGLIQQRMANKDIARALDISVGTAKNHVHNILHKLAVRRRVDAARLYRAAD